MLFYDDLIDEAFRFDLRLKVDTLLVVGTSLSKDGLGCATFSSNQERMKMIPLVVAAIVLALVGLTSMKGARSMVKTLCGPQGGMQKYVYSLGIITLSNHPTR